ncbi:histidinol-phosphate transaminase [Halanaerobium salsuginis]|jgi:histidinol-phosphate aminotransferase|uniref:Histidinol-phosphate aminotransferase n=1 Tax=Halanaerobium salsuginis TaxID=29563 RepID=A0A1I4ND57_9FIRM|nr:histidinol-phosphate transaminase [Halanaerobium salsuginis]SFM13454.1 histidinol-phosphate aminotransferase [Halanaerobium salsuginis]
MNRLMADIKDGIKAMHRYQAGKSVEEVKREYGLNNIIKLASNENPLGPAPEVIAKIKSAAGEVCLYPDSDSRDLKLKLAEKYQLPVEKIFIGNGSDEILDLLMTLVLTEGSEVIQADPAFAKYELAVQSRGGKSIKIGVDQEYRHPLAAMKAAITEQTKVIFICNPNNPTGTTLARKAIIDFLTVIPDDILVVVDQAYQEYITAADYFDGVELLADYPNLFLMRTFSKAYGLAGMRIGYALGNSELIDYLNRLRGPFNVNRLAQQAAVQALTATDHLKKCLDLNKKEKNYLYNEFEKLELDYIKTEANFVMVDSTLPAAEVFIELQKRGIIIRPGSQFGMESWLRVSIGTREQNKLFLKNLAELLAERSS